AGVRVGGTDSDEGGRRGAFGVGAVVTASWGGTARRRCGAEAVVSAATSACAAALASLSFAASVPRAMLTAFLGGSGWVAAMTSLNVAMQLRSPETILGRCSSIYQAVTFGGMASGAWAWGSVADSGGSQVASHAAAAWSSASSVLRVSAPMPTREEGRLDIVQEPANAKP
ncbi:hypothetical protein OY671_009673, partial [Metschnikowia pulcherrima]